jgi:hypothetical protein
MDPPGTSDYEIAPCGRFASCPITISIFLGKVVDTDTYWVYHSGPRANVPH